MMGTGNGFNKLVMYILPSKQQKGILFKATRTFDLQHNSDTSGIIYHQVKYFAKANSAFTIFLH